MPIIFDNVTFTGGILLSGVSGTPGPTPLSDQYFQYTTLLLDGLGTNGAQNNTFLDSSSNNFTVTRNGNTTQGSFTPFSHSNGYWSNYFDGSGDYLTLPSSSALLGSGNFTVEFWVNVATAPTGGAYYTIFSYGTSGSVLRCFVLDSSGTKLGVWIGASNIMLIATTAMIGQWAHIALVRSGTTITAYINGVSASTYGSDSTNYNTGQLNIGRDGAANFLPGYLSNFRIVVGTAVYTSNFTPSTTPLTAIANTSLLTCQSNNFKDNSTNNFAITSFGNTTATLFQPFTLSTEYNSSTMGGSMYFDGTNSRLTVANNAAFNQTGSWTVEMWIYSVKRGAAQYFYTQSTSGYAQLTLNSSNFLEIDLSGVGVRGTSTAVIPANTWTHVAMVSNGTQIRLFVDGILQGTPSAFTGVNSAKALTIGSYDSPSLYFGGYISNLRVVAGTAVYTANFTPPTSPVTAISGTSLLLNGTNAGVFDSTGFNDSETVGNARISTAQSKWGGSSLFFDGTGDYLLLPNRPEYSMLTENFTIEFWVFTSSTTAYATALRMGDTWTTGSWSFYINDNNGNGNPSFWSNSLNTSFTCSGALVNNGQWNHIALVRQGSTFTMYINGVSRGTLSNSGSLGASTTSLWVGRDANNVRELNGYLQGIRITKGIARYTGTFTPPTDY